MHIWQLVTRKQLATASLNLLAACRLTLGCNQAAWMVALFRNAHLPPGPEPSDRPHCDPPLLPRLPHPALKLHNVEQPAAMIGTAPTAPFPPLSLLESAISANQQLLATYPDGEAAILYGSRFWPPLPRLHHRSHPGGPWAQRQHSGPASKLISMIS